MQHLATHSSCYTENRVGKVSQRIIYKFKATKQAKQEHSLEANQCRRQVSDVQSGKQYLIGKNCAYMAFPLMLLWVKNYFQTSVLDLGQFRLKQ